MSSDSVKARHRRRRSSRSMRTYDGVTDAQIFERDRWECQMPLCLHPWSRRIYRGLPLDHPYRASIDHITPLSNGGTDAAGNKRAAHQRCNQAHGNRSSRRIPRQLRQRLADAPGADKMAALFYPGGS